MKTEYERMVREFLPALRASAARKMHEQYKINQITIAQMLGTTQAAVSKYISRSYSTEVRTFEKSLSSIEVEAFVKNIMERNHYGAQRVMCKMCSKNLSFKCTLMIK